jgi:hypothetical protein
MDILVYKQPEMEKRIIINNINLSAYHLTTYFKR